MAAALLGLLCAISWFIAITAAVTAFKPNGSDIQLILAGIFAIAGTVAFSGSALLYTISDLRAEILSRMPPNKNINIDLSSPSGEEQSKYG